MSARVRNKRLILSLPVCLAVNYLSDQTVYLVLEDM